MRALAIVLLLAVAGSIDAAAETCRHECVPIGGGRYLQVIEGPACGGELDALYCGWQGPILVRNSVVVGTFYAGYWNLTIENSIIVGSIYWDGGTSVHPNDPLSDWTGHLTVTDSIIDCSGCSYWDPNDVGNGDGLRVWWADYPRWRGTSFPPAVITGNFFVNMAANAVSIGSEMANAHTTVIFRDNAFGNVFGQEVHMIGSHPENVTVAGRP